MLRPGLFLLLALVSRAAAAQVIVDPPRNPDDLRASWRYIGLEPDPSPPGCPQPNPKAGWVGTPLFPGTDNRLLARFCVYENTLPAPAPPRVDGLLRLDRDAMAVLPSGGALDDALSSSLAAHFLSQAGDFEPPLTGAPRVRLAVVDTAATRETGGENYPGTSPHGYTLLNLARRLTCAGAGETNCLAQVSSRLALGWECFDRERLDAGCRDVRNGGLYGLIGEMAYAIHAEVQQWRVAGPPRLVLNLSIGWDAAFGGLEPSVWSMPAPVAAVHAAIEDAVCRGALVVAAAGNREGGPTPEVGPIVPAAWEQRAAPSFATCQALGTSPRPAHFPGAGGVYRPLVYAAAGVRADGGRLFNSRTGSAPPLAAFSDHARVATLSGPVETYTAALTGSSGAALVTSAAATVATYYRPDLQPYEVMTEVYAGGSDLGRAAEFCLGGAPCPVVGLNAHRVTTCGTLAQVCANGGGACPSPLPACAPAAPLDLSAVDLTAFRQGATAIDAATLTQAYPPSAACRFEQLTHARGDVPVDPCPHWQYFPRDPARATQPQPGSYPCPNCTYGRGDANLTGDGGRLLYVEIDSEYEGDLTEATLKCGARTWALGGPAVWHAGDKAEISGLDCPLDQVMQVSFTVDGGDSASSPVQIEP